MIRYYYVAISKSNFEMVWKFPVVFICFIFSYAHLMFEFLPEKPLLDKEEKARYLGGKGTLHWLSVTHNESKMFPSLYVI